MSFFDGLGSTLLKMGHYWRFLADMDLSRGPYCVGVLGMLYHSVLFGRVSVVKRHVPFGLKGFLPYFFPFVNSLLQISSSCVSHYYLYSRLSITVLATYYSLRLRGG